MNKKEIQELLQEGFEEGGTIDDAFESLIEHGVRDLFNMNKWDEPEFTKVIVPFQGKKYNLSIKENGCCEATSEHRIMYWKWEITEVK
jgi:hypothetical protein